VLRGLCSAWSTKRMVGVMTPRTGTDTKETTRDGRALGDFLKDSRQAMHLTLRDVEAKTDKAVTNGYLSQIEKNSIKRPSPNVLYHLARVYGLDYRDLLQRAGHHVPTTSNTAAEAQQAELAGLPLRALAELDDDERRELTEYIAWMRQRRNRRSPQA
jgi:transcriptional regulator with XRE-family HTH domain